MVSPIGMAVILLVLLLPVLYIAGEVKQLRYLRVGAFALLLPICVFVAWGVGMLQQLDYNAHYGGASQSLIQATLEQIEGGNIDHVIECLKELDGKYQPTYENRANYDALTKETVQRLKSMPVPPAKSPLDSATAAGAVSTAAEASETDYEKPAGWMTVDVRGHFSMDLPPRAEEVPVQGIDSLVGKYRIGDIELTYDYGAYSSTLEELSRHDGYSRTEVVVDGCIADLVATSTGDLGLAFPKVPSGPRLTLHAHYTEPESEDIVRKVLLSVSFPR